MTPFYLFAYLGAAAFLFGVFVLVGAVIELLFPEGE